MFKKILAVSLISFVFGSKQNKTTKYLDLANSIIEIDDKSQIESLSKKTKNYFEDRNTAFINEDYVYDASDRTKYVSRGGGKFIETQIQWFLLIDNLKSVEYLFEFDWKPDLKTFELCIDKLAKKKGYSIPKFPIDLDYSGLDTGGVLSKYNVLLKQNGFVLINLDIDSDSYVTCLVLEKNAQTIIRNAKELNQKIWVY